MKNITLCVLLCSTFVLRASDTDDTQQIPLPHFKFGVVIFDDKVSASSKYMTQKIAAAADSQASDFANLYKHLAQMNLTQVLQEPGIGELSKEIYKKSKAGSRTTESI